METTHTYFYAPMSSNMPLADFNLSLLQFGFQDKDKAHKQGPLTKTEHVLQYISEGKGTLRVGGKTYELNAGDLFYLPKNVMLSYNSESSDPYTYYWIGFDGASAAQIVKRIGLTPENAVRRYNEPAITAAYERIGEALAKNNLASYTEALGEFYKLLGLLLSFNNENIQKLKSVSVDYVDKAIIYIQNNFNADINVTSIAEAIGLGRNYFSVIFHKYTGITPVEYLMRYRIDQAQKMLSQGMPVTETAISCGFNSPANFSVQFKNITGISPVKYKNQ